MIKRFSASALLLGVVAVSPVHAAGLPAVKADERNQVPACSTPGRLMAFLKERNPKVDSRFESIAADYMRVGTELGMRWDYAFFQMMVDTSALAFSREGRSGDVKADQNNFAGLGATGKGERGERFPDVATGVTAHLQHVLIYAGERVPDAVSERTRNVQKWGVLNEWQKKIKGAISYAEVARRWAPGADEYGKSIEQTASRFYNDHCNKPDPAPELTAAKGSTKPARAAVAVAPAPAVPEDQAEKISGAELARNAIAAARAEAGSNKRLGLGAGNLARAAQPAPAAEPEAKAAAPAFTVLNAPKSDTAEKAPEKPAAVQQASAGGLAKPQAAPSAASSKCRVWQASYGGQRAMIIKSKSDGFTNYTVLDVNDGAEKREAEAYIQAYAKGGEAIGEFNSSSLALDKAFDLCPEG